MKQADEDKRRILSNKKIEDIDDILFRKLFIQGEEDIIVKSLINFFNSVKKIYNDEWNKENSIIKTTVCFRALLDVYEKLSSEGIKNNNLTEDFYFEKLNKAKDIDFKRTILSSKGVKELRDRFFKLLEK